MKSYGILLYYVDQDNKKKFLIYQRRDSHAFISLLRHCHRLSDDEILKLSDGLTLDEKQRLKNYNFDDLWDDLIINKNCRLYNTEKKRASSNFYKLKQSGLLEKCINNPNHSTLEWSFPKGRQKKNESHKQTALREFQEETCINPNEITLLDHRPLHCRLNNYLTTLFIAKSESEIPIKYKKIDCIRKSCVSEETNDLKWIFCDERDEYLNSTHSRFIYYVNTSI